MILVSSVVVAFLISLLILYPKTPTIVTNNVGLSHLTWQSNELTGAISANLTLSVSITMENRNYFGAYFDTSPIEIIMKRNGVDASIASMQLPAGYIGPHAQLDLFLTTDVRDTQLSGMAELLTLAQHMEVGARSESHGHVRILGIDIPWTVQAKCTAVCRLNLWTLEVSILEQECESHAS